MHIYLDDTIESLDEAAIGKMIDELPEWRRQQALRFRHLSGQCENAMAYMLLCKGLTEKYGIDTPPEFIIGEHGKPFLKTHPDIHFNLSHCKKAVICVLHDQPIGVDIERTRPIKESLVDYTMSKREKEVILGSENPEMEFTRLWTAKEATVKLTGNGIQGKLQETLSEAKQKGIEINTVSSEEKGYAYSIAYYI